MSTPLPHSDPLRPDWTISDLLAHLAVDAIEIDDVADTLVGLHAAVQREISAVPVGGDVSPIAALRSIAADVRRRPELADRSIRELTAPVAAGEPSTAPLVTTLV